MQTYQLHWLKIPSQCRPSWLACGLEGQTMAGLPQPLTRWCESSSDHSEHRSSGQ